MAGQDRAVKELAEIIASAAPVLRRALWNYYPTGEDSGIVERHLTVYVSHALLSAGIVVYPESRLSENEKRPHVDFAAYDPLRKVIIAAECKSVVDDSGEQGLAEDAQKLRRFSPIPQKDYPVPSDILHLLLAVTYKLELAKWWGSETLTRAPGDRKGRKKLREQLGTFPVRRAVTVVSREIDKDENYDLAMLLAIRKATE